MINPTGISADVSQIKFDIDEARSIQNIKNIASKDKNLIISDKDLISPTLIKSDLFI